MRNMEEGVQHGKGCAVQRRRTISTDAGVQYGSVTSSVQWRHIIRMDKGVEDGSVTSSLRMMVSVQDHQNCSGGCWWLYSCRRIIFDKRSHYDLDFMPSTIMVSES